MTRPTRAIIDCEALHHNLAQVRAAAPGRQIMAIVKANGYGHGIVRVARLLGNTADAFGVACLEEAQMLRAAGINQPITLLEGVFDGVEYSEAARLGLTVTLHHPWQLETLLTTPLVTPLSVWLKVDTGMHRLGLDPEQIPHAWEQLRTCPWVSTVGLMSHFAQADEPELPATPLQLDRFQRSVAMLPGDHCLANSAAILAWPASHGTWVRPGLMLYGASPFLHQTGEQLGLRPVMTFTSALIAVKTIRRGEAVGYGAAWRCTRDTTVGVVAAGYADGYPRHAPSGTPVLVNGQPVPLVGRVSMDMLCVDLATQPQAQPGDPAILWGPGLPVERIASAAGTISYEILCHIAPRVRVEERGETQHHGK